MTLNQELYIEKVLNSEGMCDCHTVEVPMTSEIYITLNEMNDTERSESKRLAVHS